MEETAGMEDTALPIIELGTVFLTAALSSAGSLPCPTGAHATAAID
jgi:hypothetical protein